MERTIRVTGKGKISVQPDTIRLMITQQGVEKEYAEALKASATQKAVLTNDLAELGFSKSDLKTLYFNVDTRNESYQTKDKSWRQRLVGYCFIHRMKLEFPVNNELLGKVLMVLSRCKGEPEFSIEYTIADKESAKNELLGKAVADSRAKAEVLCNAAGVELKEIQTIDYSWGEINFVSRPVDALEMKALCCEEQLAPDGINLDIEADDIDVTDTVTVIWRIV